MSKNDITIRDQAGHNVIPTRVYNTALNTTAIAAGEPVMLTAIGTSQFVIKMTDNTPAIGTDYVVGIAASPSTQTATAAGTVEVYLPLPGVVYRGKAKSATAADTQAEIDALKNKRTVFDLTTSVYTIDTGASDAAGNGLIIVGGDPSDSSIDFQISLRATNLGF